MVPKYEVGEWYYIKFGLSLYKAKLILSENNTQVFKATFPICTIIRNGSDIVAKCKPPSLFQWIIGWY